MPAYDRIVIGASAGGVDTLIPIVADLPADFPAAIFIVVHFPANAVSVLPDILRRRGRLPVDHPADNQAIQSGHIYIAPPDHHLTFEDDRIRLGRGPKENGYRPSIDVLFRSAARTYGPRVVGVILSGTLDDGTYGLAEIKNKGGVAVVQDPASAIFPGMPLSAIEHVKVDHIEPVNDIGALLTRLAGEPTARRIGTPAVVADAADPQAEAVQDEIEALESGQDIDGPTIFTCPECGGVLWEVADGDLVRYRCHVGHVYNAESLLSSQEEALEAALWSSVRALEESAALARRTAARLEGRKSFRSAARFQERADDLERQADVIRGVLASHSNGANIER